MKFMLLQHYGRVVGDVPPMRSGRPRTSRPTSSSRSTSTPSCSESGEFVEAQGLTGAGDGEDRARQRRRRMVVTDGPFPESKELLAGWRMVDVESEERALEIAARASGGPGPDGVPLRQQIEVRQVMGPIEPTE